MNTNFFLQKLGENSTFIENYHHDILYSVRSGAINVCAFSKLIPQSLASTLSGVSAGECGASLAYILFNIKENGSFTDKLLHYVCYV